MVRTSRCAFRCVFSLLLAASVALPPSCLGDDKTADDKTADDKTADDSKPDTYRLIYKFQPDQVVHYDVSQTTERRSRRGTQHQVVKENVHEEKHLKVVSVEDDAVVLKTVYDHVTMEAEFDNGKTIKFDSKLPAKKDPVGFHSFRDMITNPAFHVRIAPNGRLLAVKRLAKPRATPSTQAATGSDGTSFLVVFPEKALAVGDTWTETYPVEVTIGQGLQRRIEILRTYRLREVEDGIATISFSSSFKVRVRDPKVLAQLIQTAPSGTVEFDLDAGQIVKRTQRIDKTVLNPSGPQSLMVTKSTRVEKRVKADTRTASR